MCDVPEGVGVRRWVFGVHLDQGVVTSTPSGPVHGYGGHTRRRSEHTPRNSSPGGRVDTRRTDPGRVVSPLGYSRVPWVVSKTRVVRGVPVVVPVEGPSGLEPVSV